MTARHDHAGLGGWALLGAYVLGYDSHALAYNKRHPDRPRPTLSAAFARELAHPRHRRIVIASWAVVTFHLFVHPLARWRQRPGQPVSSAP